MSERSPIPLGQPLSAEDLRLWRERCRENWEVINSLPSGIQYIDGGLGRGIDIEPATGDEGYKDLLPKWNGMDLSQVIDWMVRRRLEEGITRPTTLLDIGFGAGVYLLECTRRWPKERCNTRFIGYGSTEYLDIKRKIADGRTISAAGPQLRHKGVEFTGGDVVLLEEYLDPDSVDILTCNQVMYHVRYPNWEVVRSMYSVLAPGGVAFLNASKFRFAEGSLEDFQEYLRSQGYDFTLFKPKPDLGVSMVFSKTKPTLDLPIEILRGTDPESQKHDYTYLRWPGMK